MPIRILIVGLNFHPELTGIGKYTGEMAAFLSAEGHQVRVITAPPYYPYWKVQPGYRWWTYRRETWSGVQVFRCPVWVPERPCGLTRIWHLLSFAFSSFPVLLGQIFWAPQVILCIAPSLFSAPFALLAARLSGARAWLHIQDFELEAASQLGMLGASGRWMRLAAAGESRLLAAFDRVSTISEAMLLRLEAKGVRPEKAILFPNWVETQDIFPLPDPAHSLRQIFGIPVDKLIVLYSGSMGSKQGLEVLIDAARDLRGHADIHFVLCGQGSARAALESAAAGLPNVQLLPLQPMERLNQLLNAADIHVLPQRAGAADLVMPSKLPGMLASARPVIALARAGTQISRVLSEAGLLSPPGDARALADAILRLAQQPAERRRLGEKGREYVCAHWGTDRVLRRFLSDLTELAGTSPAGNSTLSSHPGGSR